MKLFYNGLTHYPDYNVCENLEYLELMNIMF